MKNSPHVTTPKKSCSRKVKAELRPVKTDCFKEEVCQVYDLLIGTGMEPNEAIRKTRSALKAINYPFVTYDNVMAKLRASGRLRKHSYSKNDGGQNE